MQVSGVNVLEVRQEVWRASRRGDIGPRFQRALLGWLGSGRNHCAHRVNFLSNSSALLIGTLPVADGLLGELVEELYELRFGIVLGEKWVVSLQPWRP